MVHTLGRSDSHGCQPGPALTRLGFEALHPASKRPPSVIMINRERLRRIRLL